MTWIKICGLTRVEDAAAVAGADAAGFVFHPPSPRVVDPMRAAAIAAALRPGIARVGVFVNAAPAYIDAVRRAVGLDIVQLHGDEPAEAVAAIACQVIRAVRRPEDFARARHAVVLVDGARPGFYGGTGMRAAPAVIDAAQRQRRWILSGGLDAATVAAEIAALAPWGVDVSSGVERAPGLKDADKIAAFIAAVRHSDAPSGASDAAADRVQSPPSARADPPLAPFSAVSGRGVAV